MKKSIFTLVVAVISICLLLTACNNSIIPNQNGNQEGNNEEIHDVYLMYVSTVGETNAMSYEDWLV